MRRSLNRQVYGRSTEEFGKDSGFQSPNKIGRNKREVAFIRDLFDHHQDLNNLELPHDTSKSIEDPEINLIKQEINKRDRLRAQTVKYQTLNRESFRELEQTKDELNREQNDTKNDGPEDAYEQYQFSSTGP